MALSGIRNAGLGHLGQLPTPSITQAAKQPSLETSANGTQAASQLEIWEANPTGGDVDEEPGIQEVFVDSSRPIPGHQRLECRVATVARNDVVDA
jgi:hypothetical protein